MSAPRPIATAGLIASATLAVLALTGCAGDSPGSDRTEQGIPDDWTGPVPDPLTGEPAAGWIDDDEFAVITMGSGSCPPVPSQPEVVGDNGLRIEFGPSPNEICTADMGPTTHIFALPDALTDRPIDVTITYSDYDEVYELQLP